MILWIDAQLSPYLGGWITETFGIECQALRDIGLRDATDHEIFMAGQAANVVILTRDSGFLNLLERYGPPPQIIWFTLGNTPNTYLRALLERALPAPMTLLNQGEHLIEMSESQRDQ